MNNTENNKPNSLERMVRSRELRCRVARTRDPARSGAGGVQESCQARRYAVNKSSPFLSIAVDEYGATPYSFCVMKNQNSTSQAGERTQTEIIADRAMELEVTMKHGDACYMACREAGIAESEVPSTASVVSTIVTNRAIAFSGPARIATERETLKLRGEDRIEGDEIVLAFKKGREVRMARAEWEKLVATKTEPHAIASLRLK